MTINWRYVAASTRLLTLTVIAAAVSLGSGCASLSPPFGIHHQADDPAAGYTSIMRAAGTIQQRGDLATAAMLYQRAHQLNPQEAPPLVALGEIAALAGAHAQAATAFREALHRAPDGAQAAFAVDRVVSSTAGGGRPDAAPDATSD